MRLRWHRVLPVCLALLPVWFGTAALAQERQVSFPTISLVSGFAPGGGDAQGSASRGGGPLAMRPRPVYDLTARLYSRHLGRFLLGNPEIVLKHRPGAGSLRAARWLLPLVRRSGVLVGKVAWHSYRVEPGVVRVAWRGRGSESTAWVAGP